MLSICSHTLHVTSEHLAHRVYRCITHIPDEHLAALWALGVETLFIPGYSTEGRIIIVIQGS